MQETIPLASIFTYVLKKVFKKIKHNSTECIYTFFFHKNVFPVEKAGVW